MAMRRSMPPRIAPKAAPRITPRQADAKAGPQRGRVVPRQSMQTPSVSQGMGMVPQGRNNPGGVTSGPKVYKKLSPATGITASQSLASRREDTKATAPTAAAKAASRREALAKFGTGSREVPRQQTVAKKRIAELQADRNKNNSEEIARLKKKFNLK